MRLLFVDFTLPYLLQDADYPVGGWAVELDCWLRGLSAAGHDAGVLSWKGASSSVLRPLPYRLLDTYDPSRGIRILKYLYQYFPTMLRAAKDFNPDVLVQACAGVNTAFMAAIAMYLQVPFVYRVANDMDVDERIHVRLKSYETWLYRWGLKKAAGIACQNRYQFETIKRLFPKKAISLIHNPFCCASIIRPVSRSDRSYVAWLGVFQSQKNLPLLLSIASTMPHVEFRVAGTAANSIDAHTRAALEGLESLSNVQFLGYLKRTEVPRFLGNAITLLSTSLYEGFSNTFLEALAVGTPIVALRRVDPDMLITSLNLGRTSDTPMDLQGSLQSILEMDHAEFEQMATRCIERLHAMFGVSAKVSELMSLFASLPKSGNKLTHV